MRVDLPVAVGFSARVFALAVVAALTGCASNFPLMPTPEMYAGAKDKLLFTAVPADRRVPSFDLPYVTARAPSTAPDDPLPYSSERSRSRAFGSATVEFDMDLNWDELVKLSTTSERAAPLDLTLGPVKELGRFPRVVYGIENTPAGVIRDRAVVDAHEQAAAGLQAEVARRLAASPRKEVVLFVHRDADTFRDAVLTMGELCHYLGRELVCAIYSWPAGGSRGLFVRYNVERELGEFAVWDLKKAIRIIAGTQGVERVHLVAHSRGTDVLTTALGQLMIETYIGKTNVAARFEARNVVLLAPDIDADIATTKVFNVLSHPDLPYGDAPSPRAPLPRTGLSLTAYVSPDDKALSVSRCLFGSLLRLGRLDATELSREEVARIRGSGFVDLIQVSGKTDPFGRSYFTSNPEASSDLTAMIRYGLKPGETGRPLVEIAGLLWRVVNPKQGGAN